MATLRIAALQHDIVWNDREANFERLAPQISAAAGTGAGLVLCTETFSTGFVVDDPHLGEPEGGPSAQFLAAQATDHGIWVGGSCPEIPNGSDPADRRPANCFVLCGPGGEQHRYRKIHPFTYGGEDRHFRPGDGFTTVEIGGVRLTMFVCYDLRFADEFWGLAEHTDAYLIPANWPAKRRLHWQALLQARAIENQAYVVGVNRVGPGGGIDYCGDSRIVDPLGELLVTAAGSETMLVADLSTETVAQTRAQYPFLQDRRPTPVLH